MLKEDIGKHITRLQLLKVWTLMFKNQSMTIKRALIGWLSSAIFLKMIEILQLTSPVLENNEIFTI